MKPWIDTTFIIDKSGSMSSVVEATISGFNQNIADQRKLENVHQTVTLIQFDDQYEVSYVRKPIAEIPELDTVSYRPRGNTALYDAIGKTIVSTTEQLESLSKGPDKILFVIITDGCNNASKEWTKAQIKDLIQSREKDKKWTFTFMGANIDVATESNGLGISINNSLSYVSDSTGVSKAFTTLSRGTSLYSTSNEVRTSSFFSPAKDGVVQGIIDPIVRMNIKK